MSTRKILRAVSITLLILLLIAAGAGLWLATNYKGIIQQALPAISAKATDSLYHIRAGDVHIDFRTRDVTITDLELTPNAQHLAKLRRDYDLPPVLFTVRIPKLFIRHLSIRRYLEDKELVADELRITDPLIRITRLAAPPAQKEEDKAPPRIEMLKVGSIRVENPDVEFTDETSKQKQIIAAKGGSIRLTDWQFDLRGEADSTRLFYASRTEAVLKAFRIRDPSGMYAYTTDGIAYDQAGSTLELRGLRIKPLLSREAFYRRVGFQKEIYDVTFPLIRLAGLDWQRLVHGGALVAERGLIQGGNIGIYMDRVPPPNLQSKNGKFPHQMLMKLKTPVYIPRLDVEGGQFAYMEKNQKTMQAGTVRMTSISGRISNVTNIPARIRQVSVCTIDLKGAFKGSTVDAMFRFPLGGRRGAFSVEGRMSAVNGTRLNDLTRPLALADIERMDLGGIAFRIEGSESGARGTLTMRYKDLEVDLLEKEKRGGLGKKHVTSFVADKLLIYPANPMRGKSVRSATPSVDRDPTKSFFNIIWKCIFTGVLQNVQRVGFLDDAVNKKARKAEEKRKLEETPAGQGKDRRRRD